MILNDDFVILELFLQLIVFEAILVKFLAISHEKILEIHDNDSFARDVLLRITLL